MCATAVCTCRCACCRPADDDRAKLLARITEKSQAGPGDCVLWTGRVDKDGYGVLSVHNRKRRVHRIAFELMSGPIPTGMTIDHLCHVKHCFAANHLELATRAENSRRGATRQRVLRPTCRRGHLYTQHGYVGRNGHRTCRACRGARITRHRQLATT